jgi:hypothetical protein
MCAELYPVHPNCGHEATGTMSARTKPYLVRCTEARRTGVPCDNPPCGEYNVSRGYCDVCIIDLEWEAQCQGDAKGVCCARYGVSYSALVRANPGMLE